MSGMERGLDVICVSSIDWDFIWQGHQQVMTTLAEQGNRVLFIENTGVRTPTVGDLPRLKKRLVAWWRSTRGFRKERENLFVHSPLVLPFPYSGIARRVNRLIMMHSLKRWMRAVGFSRPVLWIFLPTPLSLDLMRALDPKVTIYYCIDNFTNSSFLAGRITRSETRLLQEADLVFVTSHQLFDRARPHARRLELFPFGVDLEHFEKVRSLPAESAIPDDLGSIPRPVAGYVGGIHKWVDQGLIAEAARSLPKTSFVFIGPIQADVSALQTIPNVHFLGVRDHEQIPYYVRAFDVGLIPYVVSPYTNHVYPTKLNEYLAMGKPVVSTSLEEIRQFNGANGDLVRMGADTRGFIREVGEAVRETDDGLRQARIAVASQNAWTNRIEQMSTLIQERLRAVELSGERGWEERLLTFYRASRRRVVAFGASIVLLYGLLFHSPLPWLAAAPLRIEDPPRRADAIVVFAGGVGESGIAGQGYQERVKQAAQLYHAGHAGRLVFSSGYLYSFAEADVMKSLALSLGVPAEAITLEYHARNTFENVTNVKAILDHQGWRSVLLVSSPYHMRRASLTFRKLAPEIRLIHAPVPDSIFFAHDVGANVEQIRAIVHEYFGIAYYWWKGHI